MRKKRKGFTLLEVFVVTVIVAILLAVVWVNYSGFIKRQNVRAAAEEIVANLRLAQANAVKEERYYTAYFRQFYSSGFPVGDIYTNTVNIRSNTDADGGIGASQIFKTIYFKEVIRVNFPGGKDKVILNPNGTISIAFAGFEKFIAEKKCDTGGIIGVAHAQYKTGGDWQANPPSGDIKPGAGMPDNKPTSMPTSMPDGKPTSMPPSVPDGKPTSMPQPAPSPTVNTTTTMTISIGSQAAYIDIQSGGKISLRY